MGGPGASVLVSKKLTKQQERELETWLRSITHDLEPHTWGYEFRLNKDTFSENVSQCLFYLSFSETREHWNEDKQKHFREQLGYVPEQFIGVSSACNQDEDHLTLGHFVLHLAKVYDD